MGVNGFVVLFSRTRGTTNPFSRQPRFPSFFFAFIRGCRGRKRESLSRFPRRISIRQRSFPSQRRAPTVASLVFPPSRGIPRFTRRVVAVPRICADAREGSERGRRPTVEAIAITDRARARSLVSQRRLLPPTQTAYRCRSGVPRRRPFVRDRG